MKDFIKGVLVGVFVVVVAEVSFFSYWNDDYKLFGRNNKGMYY